MGMTTAIIRPFRFEGVLCAFGCPPRAAQIMYRYGGRHAVSTGGQP